MSIGAPKESEESLLPDMTVLDDAISEMKKELCEARKATRRATLDWKKGSKSKGGGRRMLLEVASPGRRHLQLRALRQRSVPMAGPGFGVNRKGSLGDQSSMCSAGGLQQKRKAFVRKESAETQDDESCQQNDVEVDEHNSLEELGFVPRAVSDSLAWRESLRVKYMRDKKCIKEGFKFYDTAATVVAGDGKPHTINLSKNCYNLTLAERKDSVVSNAKWKAMIGEVKGVLEANCRPPSGQMDLLTGCERYGAQKLRTKGQLWYASGWHLDPTSNEGWESGRLVGFGEK